MNGRDLLSQELSEEKVQTKRQTYHVRAELIAKLRAYAYWERLGISEVVNLALEAFFADKEVKAVPSKRSRSSGPSRLREGKG